MTYKSHTDFSDVRLETARLILRSIRLGDEKLIFPEQTEEITQHWVGLEPADSPKELKERIRHSIEKSKETLYIELIVFTKNSHEFIGRCDIAGTDFDDFEIDLWVKKSAQRQGYAKEMVAVLLDWARKNTTLKYLVYSVTEGNIPSQALIDKEGKPLLRTWQTEKHGEKRIVRDYRWDL